MIGGSDGRAGGLPFSARLREPVEGIVDVRPALHIAYIYQSRGIIGRGSRAAPTHVYHIVQGLQRIGHSATLVALQEERVLRTTSERSVVMASSGRTGPRWDRAGHQDSGWSRVPDGARNRRSGFPYLALFDSLRMCDACVEDLRGYDVLHERLSLPALGGTLASRKLGISLVLEVNADRLTEQEFRGRPVRGVQRAVHVWATRLALKTADKVICVSAQLSDHMTNRWHVDRTKVAVLPNAADVEAFGRRYDVDTVREALGLGDEPVVLFVGGFWEWHNLQLLVEAFRRLLNSNSQVRLVLVGDGVTRSLSEDKVKEMSIQDSVIFTGAVNHSRIPEMLSIADVAVAPSVSFPSGYGGAPLKLFEYMAAGKAIVATRIGQMAEVIEEGVIGLLVEPGNVAGLAEAMARLLGDPQERVILGANARHEAEHHHSWERYCRELVRLYSEVSAGQLRYIVERGTGVIRNLVVVDTKDSVRLVYDDKPRSTR